ncbi:MAG: response regulator [Pseudomonadota bacterium]
MNNILVVDDEAVQVESLRRGLRSKGYQVLEAMSAEEALVQLEVNSDKIDIVLTDYLMPGKNGMDLLKAIRKTYGSLPVIIMTAYGEKDVIIEALRNRCDSFIEKPFTLDQLMEEIERAKVKMVQNTSSHQLSQLIPKLVHQINNPLMCIKGSAELAMLQMGDTKAITERITGIIKATERIGSINREILNLGQSTQGEVEMVDIKIILSDCLKMFEDLITLKGVSVKWNLDSHNLYVSANRFGLEQLFKNLVLNAIDSMDGSHEKRLRIRAEICDGDSSVCIYVGDTGCGIPRELMDKIFTPYFTGKEHGTGLGLSVAKSIVEIHGGNIQVESEVGKGATFKVSLPLAK